MAMTNSTKKTTTRKPRVTKPKVKAPAKITANVELPNNPFVFEKYSEGNFHLDRVLFASVKIKSLCVFLNKPCPLLKTFFPRE